MIAEVITIGDEILIGQIVNTNTVWIAEKLNMSGVKVGRMVTIADDKGEIIHALESGLERADILILTGGLGPTKDDITKSTLAGFFGQDLVEDAATVTHIEALFARFGKSITALNRQQALLPSGCLPLKNELGTAPGMWFDHEGKVVVSLPGVPYEMKGLMVNAVLPKFKEQFHLPSIVHKTVLTHGMGESWLSEQISGWEDALPSHIKLAYLPSPGRVRLRLTAVGDSASTLINEVSDHLQALKKLIPNLIYGYDEDTLEEEVGKLLVQRGQTLSTAESCTGGAIAARITSISGSSAYFQGSTVSYANEIKQDVLGVHPDTIEKHGAVSEEVVIQMAEGSRRLMRTDFAISTSGIAGPTGGTEKKPVGTVWIAVSSEERTVAKKFLFGDVRERNIERTVSTALNLLRKELLNELDN